MTQVIEIRKQVYAVQIDGHLLRQHYFTKEAAQKALRGIAR